jgi:hypothetical protein
LKATLAFIKQNTDLKEPEKGTNVTKAREKATTEP